MQRGISTQQPSTYETAAERPFQPTSPPVQEYKVSPVVSAPQVYQQSPGINEVSAENRPFGTVEMETRLSEGLTSGRE
jgi:hypothetical protein